MATTWNRTRDDRLKALLVARQQELQVDVRRRMRHERVDDARGGLDELEQSDARTQDHLTFALLEMRTETLARIDAALARLESGQYGSCLDCHRPIAERRLEALPFATRCQTCEGKREHRREQAAGGFERQDRFALPV